MAQPKQQKLSAAEAYREQLRQKKNANQSGELIKLPDSGIEFELRRIDLQPYIRSGRLPDSLLRRGAAGWQKLLDRTQSGDTESLTERDQKDALETVIFMREVVQESCVNPKLVINATEDDELDPKDLSGEDFAFIFQWATHQEKGGQVEGLGKFRRK